VATAIALGGSFIAASPADAVSRPAAPSQLKVTAAGKNTLHLTWRDNSRSEQGFQITDGSSTRKVGKNTKAYDWRVNPGTHKCFKVRAYNSAGNSAWDPASGSRCATTPKK
jgi:hypothetical protein